QVAGDNRPSRALCGADRCRARSSRGGTAEGRSGKREARGRKAKDGGRKAEGRGGQAEGRGEPPGARGALPPDRRSVAICAVGQVGSVVVNGRRGAPLRANG